MKQRILFGGAFDPFHLGHAALLDAVNEHYQQAVNIVILPSAVHSQKHNSRLSVFQRISILSHVVDSYDNASLNLIEFSLPKPSYTFHTLKALEGEVDALLIGDDQLKNFHTWYNYQGILKQVKILVALRDPHLSCAEKESLTLRYPEATIEWLSNAYVPIASSDFNQKALQTWSEHILPQSYDFLIAWDETCQT